MPEALPNEIKQFVDEHHVKFVDLRFTDTRGKEQHVSISIEALDHNLITLGKTFDGSSISGWKDINSSDMILRPDPRSAFIDPFYDETTLVLRCDVIDPNTQCCYLRDPRGVAHRAEEYLKATGIADTCYIGPEPEFFIFDDVRWNISLNEAFYKIDSSEGAWNSGTVYENGNTGHRPRIKGGYFPVPPVDSSQDIRSTICTTLRELGMVVETHHHEVATSNQNEINTRFSHLLQKADEMMVFKYVVHNVAHTCGKTATFMPKPIAGDNGSGMHCNQSLAKNGDNLFQGDQYAGLSQLALHYIGGIIKHARALNAFTNPTTNSYKRLAPGFEAPVMLTYAARNRSAAIRIPYVHEAKGRRIEVRFPDPMANPYLAFAAMLMAGLDGIQHQIDPGAAIDKDLYHLDAKEQEAIPTLCSSLEQALQALRDDHAFLLAGDVFSTDLIEAYCQLKMDEIEYLRTTPHPAEFDMYYSL